MSKLVGLPSGVAVRYVGGCLSARTNLGLAYVDSFRLLGFLTQNKDALPANAAQPHLAKLHNVLPPALWEALCGVYDTVGAHDFEIELSIGPLSLGTRTIASQSGWAAHLRACRNEPVRSQSSQVSIQSAGQSRTCELASWFGWWGALDPRVGRALSGA